MIWSIIKLIVGVLNIVLATLCNSVTWLLYFGWDKDLYIMFWTDKEANVQYYYKCSNIIAWAFRVKNQADYAFDITKGQHITDEK